MRRRTLRTPAPSKWADAAFLALAFAYAWWGAVVLALAVALLAGEWAPAWFPWRLLLVPLVLVLCVLPVAGLVASVVALGQRAWGQGVSGLFLNAIPFALLASAFVFRVYFGG